MRLVCTFEKGTDAEKFSQFLFQEGIQNQIEKPPTSKEAACYQIWVYDEDEAKKAEEYLPEFQGDPGHERYQNLKPAPSSHSPQAAVGDPQEKGAQKVKLAPRQSKRFGKGTIAVIILCVLLFFFSMSSVKPVKKIPKGLPYSPMMASPVYQVLSYDYPEAMLYLDQLYRGYQQAEEKPSFFSTPQAKTLLKKYDDTPIWKGFYNNYLLSHYLKVKVASAPTFEKIRQGEIWRLFTPCILHASIFHLFFNMLWFAILGNQIEQRIGIPRFFLFIIVTGIVSNTAQYLVSGPFFLGISGVVAALAGFIFIRQIRAAWEGYSIQKVTLLFLATWIIVMFVLQLIEFIIKMNGGKGFALPNIANTAHIVGALIGIVLAYTNLFEVKSIGLKNKKK